MPEPGNEQNAGRGAVELDAQHESSDRRWELCGNFQLFAGFALECVT